jgi:hypothetical protein
MSLYDDFEPDPSHYDKEPPHIANGSKFAKKQDGFAKQQTGISLRDFFASQFASAMTEENMTYTAAAEHSYKMADAMLAQRNKP